MVTALLGLVGIVGAGDHGLLRSEHFDAKQVTVRPDGDDGVRLREVVDIDFGLDERRGYQRIIPNDFGVPTAVTAASPDANAELGIVGIGADTRIRIGNPNVTFSGQRRYELEYTLPSANLASGVLALDIIGSDETFTTDRFEVLVVGMQLEDIGCDVGPVGSIGGCAFDEVATDVHRAVFEPLKPGEGITVTADVIGRTTAEWPTRPELPQRNSVSLQPVGFVQLGAGIGIAAAIFALFRRRGRNVVFGSGGAADAGFVPAGAGPPPAAAVHVDAGIPVPIVGDPIADVPTHRVPDSRLAELATVEFAPPRGLEPWQGNVLLTEKVSDDATTAWFSEMVARGAVTIEGTGKDMVLRAGDLDGRLSAVDRGHLVALFSESTLVELGSYDAGFAAVWKRVGLEQNRFIRECGWWEAPIVATIELSGSATLVLLAILAAIAAVAATIWFTIGVFGLLATTVGAVALTALVTLVVAALGYSSMLASRTATGSALTLRTESFRRFLEASEGRHVDWAWEQGLIREYSAWAVALGAADAWSKAIGASRVPPGDAVTAPLLFHTYSSMLNASYTAPSSSGGSGGGGGSGSGGGGGSSGSW